MYLDGVVVDATELVSVMCGCHHADGDRLPVTDASEAGGMLDGMSERVPVVEDRALPCLAFVRRDDRGLDRHRPGHRLHEDLSVALVDAPHVRFDVIEKIG